MTAERTPLFCDAALAERIERVEAQLVDAGRPAAHRRNDGRGFVLPVAGGVASFAEPGSPFNKVAGLGFAGVPDAAALDEIERAFAACDAPVQVELPHLADPAIGALLTDRGYRLESFENVLGRALACEPDRVTPPGIDGPPAAATTSSTPGSTSPPTPSPTPTPRGCPGTRSSRARSTCAPSATGRGRCPALRRPARRGPRRRGRPAHRRRCRAVRRRGHRARAPPPRHPGGAALGPARRRRSRGLRRRRHRHPARIDVPAERAAPGLRPALHPRRAGEAAVNPQPWPAGLRVTRVWLDRPVHPGPS